MIHASKNYCGLKEMPDGTEEEDKEAESPPHKKWATTRVKAQSSKSAAQQRYNRHCNFQTKWATKLPWVEGIFASDEVLHMMKCKVWSAFDHKPFILASKSDTMFKHDWKHTTKKNLALHGIKIGDIYVASQCKHHKNMWLYAARAPSSILEQINHYTSGKRVQFATLFQVLQCGRPVVEFESCQGLYKLLAVLDLPSAHWCDNSGWVIVSYMYKIMVQENS